MSEFDPVSRTAAKAAGTFLHTETHEHREAKPPVESEDRDAATPQNRTEQEELPYEQRVHRPESGVGREIGFPQNRRLRPDGDSPTPRPDYRRSWE